MVRTPRPVSRLRFPTSANMTPLGIRAVRSPAFAGHFRRALQDFSTALRDALHSLVDVRDDEVEEPESGAYETALPKDGPEGLASHGQQLGTHRRRPPRRRPSATRTARRRT